MKIEYETHLRSTVAIDVDPETQAAEFVSATLQPPTEEEQRHLAEFGVHHYWVQTKQFIDRREKK